jgi:SAM-dependent methyltransferase
VSTTAQKAEAAGFSSSVRAVRHDVREPLPFADASFDACFSHMLYCMALTEDDLLRLSSEIRRVLRPGGLNVYTARSIADPDYGSGAHHGDGLYELGGFIVHFFDRGMVQRCAEGYHIVAVEQFEEGALPRRLWRITLQRH